MVFFAAQNNSRLPNARRRPATLSGFFIRLMSRQISICRTATSFEARRKERDREFPVASQSRGPLRRLTHGPLARRFPGALNDSISLRERWPECTSRNCSRFLILLEKVSWYSARARQSGPDEQHRTGLGGLVRPVESRLFECEVKLSFFPLRQKDDAEPASLQVSFLDLRAFCSLLDARTVAVAIPSSGAVSLAGA